MWEGDRPFCDIKLRCTYKWLFLPKKHKHLINCPVVIFHVVCFVLFVYAATAAVLSKWEQPFIFSTNLNGPFS